MVFHVIIVPAPDVVVTAPTTSLYIGSSLTLTCTVTLDPSVDNNETVSTLWSGPMMLLVEMDTYSMLPVALVVSTLAVSPSVL